VSAAALAGAAAAGPTAVNAITLAAAAAPDRAPARPGVGLLWMALAATLFAVMNFFVRVASAHVPWTEVAASRALVGGAIALGVARARGAPLTIDPRDRRLGWARSICGTGAMLCTFYTLGAPAIALGDVVTLGATGPIFIALLSPRLLGERSGRGLWLSTLAAFAGVALVAGPTLRLSGGLALIATLGALFSAVAMIWLRKLGSGATSAPAAPGEGRAASPTPRRPTPEAIALHFSLVAAAVMMALSIPTFRAPDGHGALLLLAAGLSGGLAQLAMTHAYALDHAARLGTAGYLTVVLSHVLGAVFLDEAPSAHQLAGTTLVTLAGVGIAFEALRGSPVRK
jgi:drug/metabolite transporter (DMT)-like permease